MRGDLILGALEDPTREAVAAQIINSGITPVEIRQAVIARDPVADLRRLRRRAPGLDDLVLFSRQMYTLMKAGVPINQALAGIVRSSRNDLLAEILQEIR